MQHTDKAIAEFEAWWDRQPFRDQFEDVKDQMRNVWLASRRELVVELTGITILEHNGLDFYEKAGLCQAIEAAGVTVRG
mgnify:CR=1 FL=1